MEMYENAIEIYDSKKVWYLIDNVITSMTMFLEDCDGKKL